MFKPKLKLLLIYTISLLLFFTQIHGEIVKKIEVQGNQRIPDDTIRMFSTVSINDDLSKERLNTVLKKIYETNFFKDVSVSFNKNILTIKVVENPIIENISYEGIKANKIKEEIKKNLNLKPRSSYNEILLKEDQKK